MLKPLRRSLILISLIGLAFSTVGQSQPAQQGPKPKPEVQALLDSAQKPFSESKWEEAFRLYNEAIAKAQELGDSYGEAVAWQRLGNTFYGQGNLLKAGECFTTAKAAFIKAGDKVGELGMMGNLAVIKDNTGYPNEARPIYLQLLAHYKQNGPPRSAANMLMNLAILENKAEDFAAGLQYAKEAKEAYRELKDLRWELGALSQEAGAMNGTGKRTEALALYEEIIVRAREGKFPREEAGAYGNAGSIYRIRGDLVKALDYLKRDLKIREEGNDFRFQGMVLTELGIVYDLLGQSELAIESLKRSAELSKKSGDRSSEAIALTNLGVVYREAKQYDKAIPPLLSAKEIHMSTGDTSGQGSCLGTLGSIYREQKKFPEALKCVSEAMEIYRELGWVEEQGTLKDGLGNIYTDMGRYDEAEKHFLGAVRDYKAVGNDRFLANTYGNMARSYNRQKKQREAEAYYKKCIDLFEGVRSGLSTSAEGKAEFLSRRLPVYQDYIALLNQQGRSEEAFNLTQKTKGRSLLDLLDSAKVSVQQEMSATERAEEADLRNKADLINAQMVKEGVRNEEGAKKRFAVLKEELAKAENRLSAFRVGLYAKHPELARKRATSTATLQQLAAKLPKNAAVLEFVAAAKPFVFVVTSAGGKGQVKSFSLGVDRTKLDSLAKRFQTALSNPNSDYLPLSKDLYKALVAPVAKSIKGKTHLVVCPDGSLWDVSFAALWDRKFLAETHEISYAYSGTAAESVLRPKSARKVEGSLLMFANPDFGGAARFGDSAVIPGQRPIEPPSRPIEPPSRPIEPPSRPIEPPSRDLGTGLRAGIVDLPGTQREADAVAKLYPGAKVYTRSQAQESAFVKEAGKYRYLHLASHAFFNDASPMLSSIVLATPANATQDGYLTAREIFDLQLNADLVVLSACNTARGDKRSGDGIVGLSWALFAAGAPAQVVSQWSVDDRATATLMTRFYQNMKAGQSKGVALRNASVSLRKPGNDPKWRHPYYWAPFIILGDWR